MPDEDDTPLLAAPLVAIFGTMLVLLFAQVLPAIRGTEGGLPTAAQVRALFGQ